MNSNILHTVGGTLQRTSKHKGFVIRLDKTRNNRVYLNRFSSYNKSVQVDVENTMEEPISNDITSIPNYGLKFKLSHTYPENWSQDRLPTLKQFWQLSSLIFRSV